MKYCKDKTRESGQLKSKEHRACFFLNYPKLKFILVHFVNREEDYVGQSEGVSASVPVPLCILLLERQVLL